MELLTVTVEKPETTNFILGQSHFIKTVEDLHEAIVGTAPQMRFGIAFCESSGPALVRRSGNDDGLTEMATRNALAVGAGHSFFVFMENGFPVNVLNAIKAVPEVCCIYCATANQVEVIVAESGQGRAILGVVDGCSPKGVEGEQDVLARLRFLRQIGYKLG
jgi:adenosine/AMP kinase